MALHEHIHRDRHAIRLDNARHHGDAMSERGLICMGRDVIFVLRGGREISARRRRDGMLHDSSGFYWPRCSVLIAPFENGDDVCDARKARQFFGRVDIFTGRAPLPPRSLHAWREVGVLDQIFYDRAGKHSGPFRHRFNAPRGLWQIVWPLVRAGDKPAILYSRDGCFRVELPRGCIVDDRGYVAP